MSKTPVRGLNQYGVTLDDNQIVNGIKTHTQAPRLIVGQDEEGNPITESFITPTGLGFNISGMVDERMEDIKPELEEFILENSKGLTWGTATVLGAQVLNTYAYTTGFYEQRNPALTTLARNYPVANTPVRITHLEIPSTVVGQSMAFQELLSGTKLRYTRFGTLVEGKVGVYDWEPWELKDGQSFTLEEGHLKAGVGIELSEADASGGVSVSIAPGQVAATRIMADGVNLNTLRSPAIYWHYVDAGVVNGFTNCAGSLEVLPGRFPVQVYTTIHGARSKRYNRGSGPTTWSPWVPDNYEMNSLHFDILNLGGNSNNRHPYAARVSLKPGMTPYNPIVLTTQNLNDLTTLGFHETTTNSYATLARNYPVAGVGGELLVLKGLKSSGNYSGTRQIFITADGRIFIRTTRINITTFGPWIPINKEWNSYSYDVLETNPVEDTWITNTTIDPITYYIKVTGTGSLGLAIEHRAETKGPIVDVVDEVGTGSVKGEVRVGAGQSFKYGVTTTDEEYVVKITTHALKV